jgi:hypothetical protein
LESHAKRRDSCSTSAGVASAGEIKDSASCSTRFWNEEALDRSPRGDADLSRAAGSRLEDREVGLWPPVTSEMFGEETPSVSCCWGVM